MRLDDCYYGFVVMVIIVGWCESFLIVELERRGKFSLFFILNEL